MFVVGSCLLLLCVECVGTLVLIIPRCAFRIVVLDRGHNIFVIKINPVHAIINLVNLCRTKGGTVPTCVPMKTWSSSCIFFPLFRSAASNYVLSGCGRTTFVELARVNVSNVGAASPDNWTLRPANAAVEIGVLLSFV